MDDDAVTAFVPGHVTGFFSSHPDDDPSKAGSRGAGVTLTDGVTVRATPAARARTTLDGTEIVVEPVDRVLDALSISVHVEATTDLPLGAGFGTSGALALGTAFAANQLFDRRLSANELVTIAHAAEVRSGTGLGDVVAQARGGVPIRLDPGGPAHNRLDAIPASTRIEYLTFGDLSTESVLSGDTDRLTDAGLESLSILAEEPTLSTFMYASRRFAREADLLTDRVRGAIEDVSAAGGEASMAMLGETVFALGTGLSEAGYDPSVCRTHAAGATVLEGAAPPPSASGPPRANNAGDL
ncbi:pantoate kinase [Halalkalicoccus jeotgali]|uniref:Pantoate kinase n=1 Tax=Halalkalicoccus jeotgali (strain DSM 18796 / CECT 7217 / JCM 14584 / KCTC 4019 / B3) TaxID=795797 RepID=D8J727_HALJB|nr:pantoate kinase [Halalkalicoccus jeotgali]ADJ15980.1 GHMP kinase [Halalkalicoccus jeotgali B3]ELY38076.1 GHMP kinase [Halalkalicoccus jeotgali B3]